VSSMRRAVPTADCRGKDGVVAWHRTRAAGVAELAPPPSDAALTHGETRVLHYLPTSLSAREIAGELYLSVNTVKTKQHLYHNSARAAVPRPSSRPAPSACSHHSSRRRR
jgi:DNA-binding CsgD family transcriptional regulator